MTPDEARKRLEERQQALTYTPKVEEEEKELTREEKKAKALKAYDEMSVAKTLLPKSIYHLGKQTLNAPEEIVHGMIQPILEHNPESLMGQMSRERGAKRKAEWEEAWKEAPGAAVAGNLLGNAATFAPISRPLSAISNLPFLWRVGANAATGAGLSALNYVNPGESRKWNALIGGTLGATLPEVLSGGAALFGKGTNYLRNRLNPEAQRLIQSGEHWNVPVFAGDIAEPGSWTQQTTEMLENVPTSRMRTQRLEQRNAAQEAVESSVAGHRQEMINTDFLNNHDLQDIIDIAHNPNHKRHNEAVKVMNMINEAGEDWHRIIKAGGRSKLLANKLESDALYDNVSTISRKLGKNVKLEPVVSEVDRAIARLSEFPSSNEKAIKHLQKIRKDIVSRKGAIKESRIVNQQGKPVIEAVEASEVPGVVTFDEARKIRKLINDEISDFYKGKNATIGEAGVGELQAISENITKVLEDFGNNSGSQIRRAWRAADQYYRENVIPYKDRALAKALKDESNPDEIYNAFVKAGNEVGGKGTGRMQKFYDSLDPKAQSAVRYGIMRDAAAKATDKKGNFSPAIFSTNLHKMQTARNVFFPRQHNYEINGLANLMGAIERAGQMKTPDTGAKTLPILLSVLYNPKDLMEAPFHGLAKGFGMPAALDALLTTSRGRNFLLASSRLDPNSPKWARLIDNIANYFASRGATTSGAAGITASKYSYTKPKKVEEENE